MHMRVCVCVWWGIISGIQSFGIVLEGKTHLTGQLNNTDLDIVSI